MCVVIFLGPSLSVDQARLILPDAVYLPPAAQGDIVTAVETRGARVIGLIDGTFRHSLSVWHSEVIYALSVGVHVIGASSMGALRAAETHVYGMVGVGKIFEWYASGRITRDDEVAVAHANEEAGFVPLSEPLVNIRATLERAVLRNVVTPEAANLVVEVTGSIFYPDRTIPRILQECQREGLQGGSLKKVERALRHEYVDQKRLDAEALLRRLATNREDAWPKAQGAFEFSRPYVFEALYNLDRRVRHAEREVPLQCIAEHVALHAPDYTDLMEAALDRGLLVFIGALLGVPVDEEEVQEERARFLTSRSICTSEELRKWLTDMDLNDSELTRIVRETYMVRRLRRWLVGNRGLDRAVRYVLDELRLRGSYPHWAAAAVDEYACAMAHEDTSWYPTLLHSDGEWLAARHEDATGRRIGCLSDFAEECGFEDAEAVRDALRRALIHRDVRERATAALKRVGASDTPALPLLGEEDTGTLCYFP